MRDLPRLVIIGSLFPVSQLPTYWTTLHRQRMEKMTKIAVWEVAGLALRGCDQTRAVREVAGIALCERSPD